MDTVPARPAFWRAVGVTFETCFSNAAACAALSVIYAVLVAIPNAVFGAFAPEVEFLQLSGAEVFAIGAFVVAAIVTFAVVVILVYPATIGGLSLVGEAGLTKQTVELGVIARRALDRALACTGAFLIVPVGVAFVALGTGGTVLLLGFAADSDALMAAGGLALLVAGVAAFYIAMRCSLAIPAVMTEALGPLDALRRSWELTRRAFWWVLGVFVITGLLGAVVGGVLSVIAGLISVGGAGEFVVAAVRNVISGVVSVSFSGVALGVVYAARALPGDREPMTTAEPPEVTDG